MPMSEPLTVTISAAPDSTLSLGEVKALAARVRAGFDRPLPADTALYIR